MNDEIFDIVDRFGNIIGQARRNECHGNPALMHRTAHVIVMDDEQRIWLQKRSDSKDIQPGKWDTSVGGHLNPGEDPLQAAVRETREEIGLSITPQRLKFCYSYIMSNDIETEFVSTYCVTIDCTEHIEFDPGEISDGRFWCADEINAQIGSGIFTPNFEDEWERFSTWRASQ